MSIFYYKIWRYNENFYMLLATFQACWMRGLKRRMNKVPIFWFRFSDAQQRNRNGYSSANYCFMEALSNAARRECSPMLIVAVDFAMTKSEIYEVMNKYWLIEALLRGLDDRRSIIEKSMKFWNSPYWLLNKTISKKSALNLQCNDKNMRMKISWGIWNLHEYLIKK